MLSLAHVDHYYQLLLTQGVLAGIGAGFLYLPALAVQAHHWRERRALAMGVAFTGEIHITHSCLGLVAEALLCRRFRGGHCVSYYAQPAHQRDGHRICVGSPRCSLLLSRAVGHRELDYETIQSCLPALCRSAKSEREGYP